MRVTLVSGPPVSGKTTWVRKQAVRGDLIVDVDAIASALSGLPLHDKPGAIVPYALAARDAVYTLIERNRRTSPIRHAWVIAGLPVAADRAKLAERLRANVVVLETSAQECARRLHAARRPDCPRIHEVINQWWQQYEPRDGEQRITTAAEWGQAARPAAAPRWVMA